MKKTHLLLASVAIALALPASSMAATLVNFEQGYDDNQLLTTPIGLLDSAGNASGVTLNAGAGTMSIEKSGSSDLTTGFVTDTIIPNDTDIDATADLGGYFLRTTGALNVNLQNFNPVFSLSFAGGASAITGEIWDIDGTQTLGTESWTLNAHTRSGGVLSLDSFVGSTNGTDTTTSLDGMAWKFSFDASGSDAITSLDFVFTGTKTTGIGVAFDNLTVAPVPLPAGGLLMLTALGAVAALRRRKKS
jgi:hypothetical protein